MSRLAIRLSGIIHVALGLGFGIGAIFAIRHLDRHGELPMTPFGFRAYAGGPFERSGWQRFRVLAYGLVASSALDVLAGASLWQGRRDGARLALVNSPLAFGMAIGFALPFLLVGVPLRLVLIILGRRALV